MATSHPSGGRPPKPWERAGNNNTSGPPKPFRPPSNTSTADSVEASGTADRNHTPANMNALSRPLPIRPRQQQQTYGGYGSNLGLNPRYGSGAYGSGPSGLGYGSNVGLNPRYGSLYGGGMYGGGSMYSRGVYGGGGLYRGSGMYGGYGMGMGMSPYGGQDSNDPNNQPPSPPGFWISFLRVLQGAVSFFGRVAMLIDQNTQAFHMLMSALLQLCDRGGMLYGELARFVLCLLGVKTKPRKMQQQQQPQGSNGVPLPHQPHGNQNCVEGTKAAAPGGGGGWDNLWGN
ncbi:peroxisomal membrane protein 13 [Brassica rapa]|nr:peroxisomal membrane protein 13 [Brassica rapa]